jgi:hypothetical protein
MSGPDPRARARRRLALISVTAVLALGAAIPGPAAAASEPATVLLNWDQYSVEALGNMPTATPAGAGQTPPVASLHLAMVELAMYDAVNAIDRTREPYLRGLPRASRTASKSAAAATAAYKVLVGLQPPLADNIKANLKVLYDATLAAIPDGRRENAGVRIGNAVASKMLAKRANDGRYVPYSFTPSNVVGKWRPELPSFISDPFAWVSNVKPFTLRRPSQFRTRGPLSLTSERYAIELNEVKALGGMVSSRTPEQTELGRFYSANPLPMMHRAFREISVAKNLSITRAARLFGMLSSASADALIGCWDDKDHWSFWRPITAIHEADNDGNPATSGDPSWAPFLPTPPYPDHPSGYNCFSGAMMYTGRAFFGTDNVSFSLTSPITMTTRTYSKFTAVLTDTIDARIYLGFHFRNPDVQGARLGRNVAKWVKDHYFERVDD